MSARAHRGASVRPDSIIANEKKKKMVTANKLQKQSSAKKANGDDSTRIRSCSFGLPGRGELSPLRCLRCLGGKMVAAYKLVSGKKRVGSTTAPESRAKSSFVAPVDSHRAEAIDDCIEFINSSSSFPRSNSVSR